MPAFAPLDQWIAAGGRSDPWLALGLTLLERWQAHPTAAGHETEPGGQAHLLAVLSAVRSLRSVTPAAPDAVVLAAWFHHAVDAPGTAGRPDLEASATFAYDALCDLGEPALAAEVSRLVLSLARPEAQLADPAVFLLHSAHSRAGTSSTTSSSIGASTSSRPAAVPAPRADQ